MVCTLVCDVVGCRECGLYTGVCDVVGCRECGLYSGVCDVVECRECGLYTGVSFCRTQGVWSVLWCV